MGTPCLKRVFGDGLKKIVGLKNENYFNDRQIVTCVYVTPLVALDTAYISDLYTKGLITYLAVTLAVALSWRIVLSLPLEFVLWLIVLLLSFLLGAGRRFVHKIHAELVLALLAQQSSAIKCNFVYFYFY